jgi:hypothetical protein
MEALIPGARNLVPVQDATFGLTVMGNDYNCGTVAGGPPRTCVEGSKGNLQLYCVEQGISPPQLVCNYPFSGKLTPGINNNYALSTGAFWPPMQGAGISTPSKNLICQKQGNSVTCTEGLADVSWNCTETANGEVACDITLATTYQQSGNNLILEGPAQPKSMQQTSTNTNNSWIWALILFFIIIFVIYLWGKNKK